MKLSSIALISLDNSSTGAYPRRILLVDDEKDVASSLMQGLELHRFTVDGYSDPTEALVKFVPEKYDIVILDVHMPKLTGFDLYP